MYGFSSESRLPDEPEGSNGTVLTATTTTAAPANASANTNGIVLLQAGKLPDAADNSPGRECSSYVSFHHDTLPDEELID